MAGEATTGETIDALVRLTHGDSDQRTQQLFRQNLEMLVELAKLEQRRDWAVDFEPDVSHRGLHTVH